MLSFKELSEKKTKVTLNPKLKDVMEKKGCNHTKKGMDCPMHGMKPCPDTEVSEGKKTGSCGKPADECMCDTKKKKKCPKCNGKGCKHCGGTGYHDGEGGENESMEEQAYVSQEEVSEESTEEVAQTETSLLTFGQFTEGKSLSIDDQMRISREYNRKSPEEKKAANKKAMGNVKKVAPKKDTRTDAQKMTDATGPRPGSRYRGD